MEQGKLDFDETADAIGILTAKAQVTILYRILLHVGPGVLRTMIKYCHQRLNQINSQENGDIPYNKPSRPFVFRNPGEVELLYKVAKGTEKFSV